MIFLSVMVCEEKGRTILTKKIPLFRQCAATDTVCADMMTYNSWVHIILGHPVVLHITFEIEIIHWEHHQCNLQQSQHFVSIL